MKPLKIRWLLLIVVTGAGMAGVISSNVGCGDSANSTGTAGTGGGSGGSTGTAGTGAGGSKPVKVQYTFDTATSSDSKSWILNDYMDPASPPNNLGWYVKGDAAITDPPSFEWASDDSESSSSSGSMKVSVTFTAYGQYVDPVINFPVMDLSGTIVSMRLRLVSGSFTGGAQFHISTGSNYTYWAGTWINGSDLTAGTWKTTNIDTSIPPSGSDPAMVVQIGIQFASGAAPDGGATPPSGRLVFEIDTVKAQ